MKRLPAIFCFVLALALFAQERQDAPPPEAPADGPTCNNYVGNEHPCHCNVAMKCKGRVDEPPDKEAMSTWCVRGYCRKDKCKCIGPCVTRLTPAKACDIHAGL
jgi:hypothetical protein